MNNVIRAFDRVPVRIEIDETNETNGDSGN
jgi:multidrug resistance efflux pump